MQTPPILTFSVTLSREITTNTSTESSLRWHQYTSGTIPNVKRDGDGGRVCASVVHKQWTPMCVRVHAAERMNSAFPLHFPERHFPSNPRKHRKSLTTIFQLRMVYPYRHVLFCFPHRAVYWCCQRLRRSLQIHTRKAQTSMKTNWKAFFLPSFFFGNSPKESGGQAEKAEKSRQIQVYRHRGGRRRRGLRWRWWVTSGSTSLGYNTNYHTHVQMEYCHSLLWCLSGVRF